MSRWNHALLIVILVGLIAAIWMLTELRQMVKPLPIAEPRQSFTHGGVTTPRDPSWSLDTWYEKHQEAEQRFYRP